MPHSRPSPAGASPADATPTGLRRRQFQPGAFAGWIGVGILWALSFASAMSIGVFLMPVALIATLVMCLGESRPEAWPGAISGIGLVGCYLAFLHRHGPGRYCTVPGDAATCTQMLNPWPFLVGGIVAIGVCALVARRWYTALVQPRHRRR